MIKRTAAALAFLGILAGCAGNTGPDQQGTSPNFALKQVTLPPPPPPDTTKVAPPETPNSGYVISW